MFFITGHGRSGTLYTAKLFQKLGKSVEHEKIIPGMDGLVSWCHALYKLPFKKTILQRRNPLKVIASSRHIKTSSFEIMEKQIGKIQFKNKTHRAMHSWLFWNQWLEHNLKIDYRFYIEDIDREIFKILDVLGYEIKKEKVREALKAIPRNTHAHDKNVTLTWENLLEIDKVLANKIRTYAGN